MIVDIFIPCQIDQYFPDTAHHMIKILERLGCGVNYNMEQTCCGLPSYEDGYWDHSKSVGEKLIREFQNDRYVVCPGSACSTMVKCRYPSMFHNSSLHNEFKQVQKHFYELSDFLVKILNVTDIGASYSAKAYLMKACQSTADSSSANSAQILASKVKQLDLVDLSHVLGCCGGTNGLDRHNEELAVNVAKEFLRPLLEEKIDTIIATDAQCIMHLSGVITANNFPIKVVHLADVLASGWD